MRTYLLAGACIIALSVAGAANAQNVATAQTAEQDVPQSQEHDIVVTAHTNRTNMAGGGMIAIQDAPVVRTTIGQGFIAKQMPAQNALAAVRLAPGANVGQDNPYGISERSDLTVRGMNQSQMGFVLEGMPLGDPNNYLPNTNEWIDNENIKSVTLTQGTSDLSSPVLSASGGLIQVNMRDPSEEMGGTVSASIGSFNAYRGFARLETGNIANTGIRIAGSYSFINADNFRGAASSRREHIDVKALKEFDNGSRVALIWTNNDFVNYRSTIVNLNQWNTAGKHQDYTADYTFGSTAYNKFYPFYRRANFVQAPSKIVLNDNVTLDVTPYYRNMQPNGPGGVNLPTSGLYNGTTRYAETLSVPYSVNGRFVAEAMSNINEQQAGVNASITWKTGHHEITAGIWYDRFWERALSKYVGVDQFGQANDRGDDYLTFSDGTVLSSTNFRLNRTAVALYANDTVSLLDDKLKLMFGFKQLFIDVTGDNYLPGATAKVGVHQTKSMPRFGATYSFGDNHQVFFDLVTNARPPAPGPSYMDVFSVTTGAKTTTGNQNTKMEYSFLQEIGYRYQGFVNFSIAGFHNKLTNHQVNTIVVQDGVMTQSQIAAGGKTIWGANVEVGLRPWHNFSPYVSGQYLHATTDDDLPVGNDYLPTKGKIAVRSPKFMGAAGITYDDGSLFSVITFRHVGSQYSTFMNDQKMAAYNTLDFGIGYRLPDIGPMKRPTVQVNLTNLTEGAYLGAIASPTGASKATVGRNGTVIAASQPGYYMNSGFVAMGSIRTDF